MKLLSGLEIRLYPEKSQCSICGRKTKMLVEKGFRVTFDLLVKIGRMRYGDHRQLEEIQSYLKCSSARIDLPLSTVSLVAKRFLESCKNLHEANEATIIRGIAINGGYFLHFDGSTEQKCGQCSLFLWIAGHVIFLIVRWLKAKATTPSSSLLKKSKQNSGLL